MALGDIVGTLTAVGGAATSFELLSNAGNFFAISGSNLIQTGDTPDGIYPITIKAIGPGYSATTSYSLDFTGGTTPFPPPPPPPPPLTSAIAVVPSTLGVGQTATVFFTWNDTVFNFTSGAVAVTNGSIGALTQVSPTLFTAIFTPTSNINATATLQVQQSGVGGAAYFNAAHSTTIASNIADVVVNTIAPVGEFFVSMNLTGAQGPVPQFPNADCISFHADRLNRSGPFRIPISWAIFQTFSPNAVVGIQPLPFGPLDTTGSYNFIPSGPNILQNSQLLASGPWGLFANGSGSGARINNDGTAPDGTNTATLITINRSDGTSYAITTQGFPATATSYTGSVWLKANSSGDVGKVISINFNDNSHGPVDITFVTLTNSWVRYNCTGVLTNASWSFTIGYSAGDGAGTGLVNILAWGAQVNIGTSPATYQETTGGYLAALDSIVQNVVNASAQCFIDIHMFGVGPGLSGKFTAALTASGTTVSATYGGAATPLDTTSRVVIVATNGAFNGTYSIFNVTPTTFQYTLTTPTTASATAIVYETANVGTDRLPISAFADLWGKIAAYYVSQPALLAGIYGFDIMNEWPNGFDSNTVFNASQAAITSIRNAGFTGFIIIEGTNFSSAWNWVTGDGQPFNSSGLFALVDPLNKLIMSPHMYPDADDSWSQPTSFGYIVNSTVPGTAPVGLNTNPMIGVERMDREYGPWAAEHGVVTILGEYGSSNDTPWSQGTFDFADWNVITRNLLTYLQANQMGFNIWSGGPGFQTGYNPVGYAGSLDPFSVTDPGQPDYVNGVQHPAMVVLDQFTGYTGPQPHAYALIGGPNQQLYCTIGTPTAPYAIYYGGLITSPVTITPHAFLTDGVTPVTGTFNPTSLTAAPGENFVGQFTFTAGQAATIVISTTNSAGWVDPPGLGISSILDGYVSVSGSPSNIYGMYNRYTPNVGPALRLERSSDAQQMDWGFTLPNSMGYNGFDRVAIQNWASAQSGIKIVKIYGIGPGQQNPISFSGATFPTLNLKNAAGYPEIVVPAGVKGDPASNDANFFTPVANQNAFYTITRMNQSPSAVTGLWRIDWDNGPVIFTPNGMQIFSTGYNTNGQTSAPTPQYPQGTINTTLSFSVTNGAYHEYGASYTSNVTNGFSTYKDGSLVAQATINYQLTTDNKAGTAQFANYKYTAIFWVGSFYNMEIGMGFALTAGQHATISSIDDTYYSTPLPDVLPAVPPSITEILTNLPIYPGFITAYPLGGIVISDPNIGATDTATITLTGAAGALSGSGISGSGPYTVGPDTPANVTTILRQAVFTTAAGVGSTTNFALVVSSSAGSSASNSSTNTTVSTYSTQASFTPPAGTFTPVNHSGYNLAGGELDANQSLGPSSAQMDYIALKGFGLFRYVMTSKFLYTTPFGQLNSGYLAKMKAVLDYAFTKNLYVVIDPHDSGNIWDATFGIMDHILPGQRPQVLFADFWRRIATAFLNYPNAIFGLNNEPAGLTAVQWRDGGCTPSIAAIRAAGATQMIFIPGVGDGANNWTAQGNTAAFAAYAGDPLSNFAFEAHQYLDSSTSGGSSIATVNGTTILNVFNGFLTTNSFKGFLGEFGMAPDPFLCLSPDTLHYNTSGSNVTTNSIVQNSNMLSVMVSSGLYVGWAAWGGGYEFATPPTNTGYAFNPEPSRNGFNYIIPLEEQPQIPPLLSFLI